MKEENPRPTIKGIFVNSHIEAVRKLRGEEGVLALEHRYGKSLKFKNSEDVPVADEVKIIEYALDLLSPELVPEPEWAFEAGRLHFRNFTTTPLAQIIFSLFREEYKLLMLKTKNIAGHVFRGVHFASEDLGPKSVRVTMKNNDYPIQHFRGLFAEWMIFAGLVGTVVAEEPKPNTYQYTMTWE
jgi:uncharacterized protein (TIGR02265 family)